ncbi:MAG TPA: M56 family metallopeptidase [Kofleriaceae bacterium]|nr:M56 family metallopeptidase [Kofleriaceae bacterium]
MTVGLIEAGAIAKAWLGALAMIAAQGTALAIVALVLSRAGKLRPSWQAALWLVVIVKFALPWTPALPWSLADLIAAITAHHGAGASVTVATQATATSPHAGASIAWLVLGIAWLAISATILARSIDRYRRAVRAAGAATPAPADARALLCELAARVGVRAPRLHVELGASPHVIGLWRSTIVIPPALLDEPQLLRGALLHELAHVRRRDGIARAVQVWAGALLFFWPVVRLAARRLDLARESACDAWALEAGELARPAYARLLVRMAELRSSATGALALAAPHALDARIAAVLGPPSHARLGRVQRIALVAWGILALGGARSASAHGDRPSCKYTPELAQALLASHPEADLDGDGVLSRDEACELQASMRRRADELTSQLDPADQAELETFLAEPLCCNCDQPEANSRPASCPEIGVSR